LRQIFSRKEFPVQAGRSAFSIITSDDAKSSATFGAYAAIREAGPPRGRPDLTAARPLRTL
jgi:hypothetical protein